MSKNIYSVSQSQGKKWEIRKISELSHSEVLKPLVGSIQNKNTADIAHTAAELAYLEGFAAGKESYRKSLLRMLGAQDSDGS
jgi:hypothetical protein